jgi:hypothetical protein
MNFIFRPQTYPMLGVCALVGGDLNFRLVFPTHKICASLHLTNDITFF